MSVFWLSQGAWQHSSGSPKGHNLAHNLVLTGVLGFGSDSKKKNLVFYQPYLADTQRGLKPEERNPKGLVRHMGWYMGKWSSIPNKLLWIKEVPQTGITTKSLGTQLEGKLGGWLDTPLINPPPQYMTPRSNGPRGGKLARVFLVGTLIWRPHIHDP